MCLPVGRAGRVEEARLHEQDERAGGMLALRGRLLRGGDLVERAAEVHGARARDLRRAPGDRPVERPVELEDARPVAVAREPPRVPVRQARRRPASAAGAGSRRAAWRRRLRARRATPPISRLDLAAERTQVGRERVGQALRAAAGDGPADPVRAQREDDAEGRAGRARSESIEWAAAAAQEGARALALEARAREPRRRAECAQRRSARAPADGAAGAAGRGSRASARRHLRTSGSNSRR